jgi:cytochrome c553
MAVRTGIRACERFARGTAAMAMFAIASNLPVRLEAQTLEAKAQLCAGCHGEAGIPPDKLMPVIAGQHQGYLYLQLRDYKLGTRSNQVMAQVVEMLEREDMMALAEYFSQQPWPALGQPSAPDEVVAVARRANTAVACTGCHLDAYQGTGTVPRLAGQSRDYLANTMAEFRSGARANNPGMSDLMKATSEPELAALADYLAGR